MQNVEFWTFCVEYWFYLNNLLEYKKLAFRLFIYYKR